MPAKWWKRGREGTAVKGRCRQGSTAGVLALVKRWCTEELAKIGKWKYFARYSIHILAWLVSSKHMPTCIQHLPCCLLPQNSMPDLLCSALLSFHSFTHSALMCLWNSLRSPNTVLWTLESNWVMLLWLCHRGQAASCLIDAVILSLHDWLRLFQ